nr:4-hydroxythreonine-4-phosphate dehydrogenase PdxA [Thermovibrio guaymasensis]
MLLKSLNFLHSLKGTFTIYGSKDVLDFYSELLSISYSLELVKEPPNERGVYLIDVYPVKGIKPGKPNLQCGTAQFKFIERAVSDAKKGKIDGIVTFPINKEVIRRAGFKFPGHTEYLADAFKIKDFAMMLSNQKLRTVLLTTHLPLRKIPDKVKREEVLKKLRLIWKELRPRKIGVCGLNPHAGEGGLFGREEIEEITPAVEKARKEGIPAFGPYPSDTLFVRALRGEFEVVLSMYHDQGLIPIKLLGFSKSVNTTLGLPIIRTSVDHGTAYDIAGKGIADEGSFKAAVEEALNLLKKREL